MCITITIRSIIFDYIRILINTSTNNTIVILIRNSNTVIVCNTVILIAQRIFFQSYGIQTAHDGGHAWHTYSCSF